MLASESLWSDPQEGQNRKKKGGAGGRRGLDDVLEAGRDREIAGEDGSGMARSVMIFVSKCRK